MVGNAALSVEQKANSNFYANLFAVIKKQMCTLESYIFLITERCGHRSLPDEDGSLQQNS